MRSSASEVHRALQAPYMPAWRTHARHRSGERRTRPGIATSPANSGPFRRRRSTGRMYAVASPSAAVSTAAPTNTARQPKACPARPPSTRAATMPVNSPPMTAATCRARRSAGARSATSGTSSCGTTVAAEATRTAPASAPVPADAAAASSAPVATSERTATRRRRFTLSPSGAKKSRPAAYPSCATEASQATADGVEPMSRAMRGSSGAAR
ncbi:hypothetical protein ADL09_06090 [Streptomyces sp. NRRL F-7442]|nr:hypothetical protein ADL09_06090 [Streptomyces sp. NRRL F-7442]